MTVGSDKPRRAYAGNRFILELDGVPAGVLTSVDGGQFKSEAIAQKVGSQGLVTQYPGRQKFEDITIQVGTSMSQGFWDWMKASIDTKPTRKNGAIVACDFDGNERSRRTFKDALISEIQFPALDASAKTPAFIQVKISPEFMDYDKKGGKKTNNGVTLEKQKMFVPANYKITVQRIDAGITKHVVKVDPITIKQNIIVNAIGSELYPRIEAGRVDHPVISVYVPENYVQPWMTWWKSFVGEMKHDSSNEAWASIAFLASDVSTELMTLKFEGVGITGLTFDKHDAGGEGIRTVKVDLYTEKMSFEGGAGVAG